MLDTCVVSELLKPQPDPNVLGWVRSEAASDMAISAVTAAELLQGVSRLPGGRRKAVIQAGVTAVLEHTFAERIVPFDGLCAPHFADLTARRRAAGRPVQAFDAMIAATALRHGLVVVTRNVADFEVAGLRVVDPWVAGPATNPLP